MAKKSSLVDKISQFRQEGETSEPRHENPLLRLLKETKKEKSREKSKDFTERLMKKTTFNLSLGVSKSALRRQKRKEREQLKPRMEDMLSSLPMDELEAASERGKAQFVEKKPKRINEPNPQKQGGHAKLLDTENTRFNRILRDEQFKETPFATLKQAIARNLQN